MRHAANDTNANTLRSRTTGEGRVRVEDGDCNVEIERLIRNQRIPRYAYGIALLDPFAPSALAFDTVRRLAAFPHMDLIINFPTGPIRRNFQNLKHLRRYMGRDDVDMVHGSDVADLIPMYRDQLVSVGFRGEHIHMPRIANSSNATLYHLIFASKHQLGDKIWNSVTRSAPNGQRSFDF